MISAAVSAYDGNREDITDPTIGQIKFVKKAWSDIYGEVEFLTELESEKCPDWYFDDVEVSPFFNWATYSEAEVKIYSQKMRCPADLDQLRLHGNYDTVTASNLMITFERCRNETNSKITC